MWRLRCGGLLLIAVLSCACLGSFAEVPSSQEKGSTLTAADSALHRRMLENSSRSSSPAPETSQALFNVQSAKNDSSSSAPSNSSAALGAQQKQGPPAAAAGQHSQQPSTGAVPVSGSKPAAVPVADKKAANATQQPSTATGSKAADQPAVAQKPGSPNGQQNPAAQQQQQQVVADSRPAQPQPITPGHQPAAKSEGVDRQPSAAAPAAAQKPAVLGLSAQNQSAAAALAAAEGERKATEQKPAAAQHSAAAAEQVPAAAADDDANKPPAGWVKPYERHAAAGSNSAADNRTVLDSKPTADSKLPAGSKAPADSKPMTDSRPAPAGSTSSADKPAAAAKTSGESKPTAGPATKSTPADHTKATPEVKPVAHTKPAEQSKPLADTQPAASSNSTAGNNTAASSQPTADSKPAGEKKAQGLPAPESKLSADGELIAYSKARTETKPAGETKTAVESKPATDNQPGQQTSTEHVLSESMPKQQQAAAADSKSAPPPPPTTTTQQAAVPVADPKPSAAESKQQPQTTGESKELPGSTAEPKQLPQTPNQQPLPATAPEVQVLPATQLSQHLSVRVAIPAHTTTTDATQTGGDSASTDQQGSVPATDASQSDAAAAEDMEAERAKAEQAAAQAAAALESQGGVEATPLEVSETSEQPSDNTAEPQQQEQTAEGSSAAAEHTVTAAPAAAEAEVEDQQEHPTAETLALEAASPATAATADKAVDKPVEYADTAESDPAWEQFLGETDGAQLAGDTQTDPSETVTTQGSPADAVYSADTAQASETPAGETDRSLLKVAAGGDVDAADADEDDFVSLLESDVQPTDDLDAADQQAGQQGFQQEAAGKPVNTASFRFVDPDPSNLYEAPQEGLVELEDWEDEEEEDAVQEWFKKQGIKPRGSRRRYYNPVPPRPVRRYRYARKDAATPSKVQPAHGSTHVARATGAKSAQAMAYASRGESLSHFESLNGGQYAVPSSRKATLSGGTQASWDRPSAGLSSRDAIRPFSASSSRGSRQDSAGFGAKARLQQAGGPHGFGQGPQMPNIPDLPDLKRMNQGAKGGAGIVGSEKWRLISIDKEEDIKWLTTAVREHKRTNKEPVFLLAWMPGEGGNPAPRG